MELRWIVEKQIGYSVTRRTMLALVGGIVGSCIPASAQVAGRLGVGAVVSLRPGEIMVTLKKVGDRWMCHMFPGKIQVDGPDAPSALRAMAERIEQTFSTNSTGGTK